MILLNKTVLSLVFHFLAIDNIDFLENTYEDDTLSFAFLRYRLCELDTLNARLLVIEQRSINVAYCACLWIYIYIYIYGTIIYATSEWWLWQDQKINESYNRRNHDAETLIKRIYFSVTEDTPT